MEPQRAVVEVQVTAGTDGGHGLVAAGRRVEHPGHQRERRPEADRRRARDPVEEPLNEIAEPSAARVGPGRTDRSAHCGRCRTSGHHGAGPFVEAVSDRWSRGRGTHGDGRPRHERRHDCRGGQHGPVPVTTSRAAWAPRPSARHWTFGAPWHQSHSMTRYQGPEHRSRARRNKPNTSGLLSCHPQHTSGPVGFLSRSRTFRSSPPGHAAPPQAHPRPRPRRDRTRLHPGAVRPDRVDRVYAHRAGAGRGRRRGRGSPTRSITLAHRARPGS